MKFHKISKEDFVSNEKNSSRIFLDANDIMEILLETIFIFSLMPIELENIFILNLKVPISPQGTN